MTSFLAAVLAFVMGVDAATHIPLHGKERGFFGGWRLLLMIWAAEWMLFAVVARGQNIPFLYIVVLVLGWRIWEAWRNYDLLKKVVR